MKQIGTMFEYEGKKYVRSDEKSFRKNIWYKIREVPPMGCSYGYNVFDEVKDNTAWDLLESLYKNTVGKDLKTITE